MDLATPQLLLKLVLVMQSTNEILLIVLGDSETTIMLECQISLDTKPNLSIPCSYYYSAITMTATSFVLFGI